jgi:hypothetical protein
MTDPDGGVDQPELDHGLIEPLAIPPDSLVPDPATGTSNEVEYDLYFRVVREDPGLLAWTRSCLRIDGEMMADLHRTGLSAEDRCDILQGLLTVHRVTLERWVSIGEAVEAGRPEEEAS